MPTKCEKIALKCQNKVKRCVKNKPAPKAVRKQARKLKIRVTNKRKRKDGTYKRIWKSEKKLKQQIKRKQMKSVSYGGMPHIDAIISELKPKSGFGQKILFDKSHTPGIPSMFMPGSYGIGVGYRHKNGVTRNPV